LIERRDSESNLNILLKNDLLYYDKYSGYSTWVFKIYEYNYSRELESLWNGRF